MYEKIAWNHFEKTGDITSFLEYKKIMELTNNMQNIENGVQEKGEFLSELDKNKGDNNQGNTL